MLAKEVRLTLEYKIGEYIEMENDWVVTKNGAKEYTVGSSCMYHDVESGYIYRTCYLKSREKEVSVTVGRSVFCVYCGNVISSSSHNYSCGRH